MTTPNYFCDRAGGCVCGGDTPGVRAGCTHYHAVAHEPAVPNGIGDHVSPWHPMADAVDLKTAGKGLEELGECTAALSRCLIQGLDGINPENGKVNRQWLEQEMDDVRAQFELLSERFGLRSDPTRIERKKTNCRAWHAMA